MAKQKTVVEWAVVDETPEAEDEATIESKETREPDASQEQVRRKETHLTTLAILLLLIVIGGWYWQKRIATTEATGLRIAIVQELKASRADMPGRHTEQLPATPKQLTNATPVTVEDPAHVELSTMATAGEVKEVIRLGNQVMAQVIVHYDGQGTLVPYRETHFYQKTVDGWMRIPPDPELMGSVQTLETEHFTIYYRSIESDAVHSATPKIEELYTRLRHDFGLTNDNATYHYTLDLKIEKLQHGIYLNYLYNKLAVPSPSLLSVPEEITPAATLYHAVLYPLVTFVIVQVVEQQSPQWQSTFIRWGATIPAMRLWAVWNDDSPLAEGHKELVQWLYRDASNTSIGVRQDLPTGYTRFCRTHRIWRLSPQDLQMPLTCTDEDNKYLPLQSIPELSTLWQEIPAHKGHGHQFKHVMALTTLIEYIVVTYGRDELPGFILALGEHKSIDTLIPAVFGISEAEFESGWRDYLAQQYLSRIVEPGHAWAEELAKQYAKQP